MTERVAILTGASAGLGSVIAHFLAGLGYVLILDARGAERLHAVAKVLTGIGAIVDALPGDVTDPSHRKALVGLAKEHGELSVLVNNASTLGATPLPPLVLYPAESLRRVFEVNLLAPMGLVQESLPLLEAGHGLVVNITSDAAVAGYPGWGGYGASKAALELASLTLAHELKEKGISVVSVDPGDLRTEMHQAAFPGEDISDRPLPDVTVPFWAWLFGQDPSRVSGRRYRAQAESWEASDAA